MAISEADRIVDIARSYGRALEDCLILNAARNILSPQARALLGAPIADGDWSGRVRGGKAPYSTGPLSHIVQLDQDARALVTRLFQKEYAEFRAPTGSVANGIAVTALTGLGDAILAPPSWAYGHKSIGAHGYSGCAGRRVTEMPWDGLKMQPNLDALREMIRGTRPGLIVLGTSRPLFPEPFSEIATIARENGSRLFYDAAHVLGLIATGTFPNPLLFGFDVIAGSTQKTLPGPLGGLIVCADPLSYESVAGVADNWLSTYSVSSLAALAHVLAELDANGPAYGARVVGNARTLGESLARRGFHVIGEARGFSATHQVIVDVTDLADASTIWIRLAQAGILVNSPSHADRRLRDAAQDGIWLRLGTALCSRLDMDAGDMAQIAEILARILLARVDPASVRAEVSDLCRRHRKVAFTLEAVNN